MGGEETKRMTTDLSTDPRPDLPDHPLWDKLLNQTPQIIPLPTGEYINRSLWMVRSVGAKLERVDGKMKIIPLIQPEGNWEDLKEWNEMAIPTLKKYAAEIKKCLEVVDHME